MEKTLCAFEKNAAPGLYAFSTTLLTVISAKEEEQDAEDILKDLKIFLYKMRDRYEREVSQEVIDISKKQALRL